MYKMYRAANLELHAALASELRQNLGFRFVRRANDPR